MTDIIKALHWRYATKKYDPKKVPEKDVDELLEVLRLAPSSFGLQPWKFIVVKNPELRAKLAAFSQPKVAESSHIIVLCARTDVNEKFIKHYVESTAKIRKVPIESLKGFHDGMITSMNNMTPEKRIEWSKKQVYLALGMLLEAAALKGIDASPMEGFMPDKFDEILNLKKEHATAAVLCALGYRAADDGLAKAAKVRFPKEEVIVVK
ncbi:MAG TPA: NAD(P)H-dependent oxidoreductase [Candidatus Nanoarchaeia archaeon]|nr:NAD(P)H-dependent oxidoreductase [Candidatus Nanoarchaeia archaeon]